MAMSRLATPAWTAIRALQWVRLVSGLLWGMYEG